MQHGGGGARSPGREPTTGTWRTRYPAHSNLSQVLLFTWYLVVARHVARLLGVEIISLVLTLTILSTKSSQVPDNKKVGDV